MKVKNKKSGLAKVSFEVKLANVTKKLDISKPTADTHQIMLLSTWVSLTMGFVFITKWSRW